MAFPSKPRQLVTTRMPHPSPTKVVGFFVLLTDRPLNTLQNSDISDSSGMKSSSIQHQRVRLIIKFTQMSLGYGWRIRTTPTLRTSLGCLEITRPTETLRVHQRRGRILRLHGVGLYWPWALNWYNLRTASPSGNSTLKRHHTHPTTQSERGDTPFGSSDRLLAIQKALDDRDNKHSHCKYYHRCIF